MRDKRIPLRFKYVVSWGRYRSNSGAYLRRLARMMKTMPIIRSGGDTQVMPKSATLFKFRTANTAAATKKMIPIKRRVLGDRLDLLQIAKEQINFKHNGSTTCHAFNNSR